MTRRPALVGAAAAAAGTAAFFWPLLFGQTFSTVAGHQRWVWPWHAYHSQNPYTDSSQQDQADLNYPWQAFLSRSLRSGDLPLWNPLSFGGQPFFSNGTSALLYPPRLVTALLFSPSVAHDIFSALHVFGAGLAMFLFCRQLGLGMMPSLFGASCWMFGSFNMAWLHLEVVAPVMVMLPLTLLLVRRAVEETTAGRTLAAAVALGLTLTSGHLLFMAVVWGVALSYGAACLVRTARSVPPGASSTPWGKAWHLAVMVAGGAALFACVLLPTAATIGDSHRKPLTYELVRRFAPSRPDVILNILRPPAPPMDVDEMNLEMVFVGTVAGVLALAGCFRRGPAPALGRVLAIGVLLLSQDTPLLRVVYHLVPGFTLFRPLGRLFFLVNFALALLAAAALEAVVMAAARRLREPGAPSWSRLAALAGQAAVPVLVLVNTVQLVRYGHAINPPFHPRTAELLFPRTPLLKAAQQHVRTFEGRVAAVDAVVPDGTWTPPTLCGAIHMLFRLPSVGGYDSVAPQRAERLDLVVAGVPVDQVLSTYSVGARHSHLTVSNVRFDMLPRLGATAIMGAREIDRSPYWPRSHSLRLVREYAGEDGQLHRIVGAPGEAWLAPGAALVDSPAEALYKMADPAFDIRRQAIIERADAPWADAGRDRWPGGAGGDARIVQRGNNRLVIDVRSDSGGWLVVAHTWDPGWRAALDGRPVVLLRANYAFRAVHVPRGEHRVEMRYVPAGLIPGLLVSGASLAVVAGGASVLAFRARGRRRQAGRA